MSARELEGSTCLNETLRYLRIESQLGFLVGHVEVGLDPRNARLPYLKVRMIARVQLPLDQYEQGTLALEALALARLVTSPKRPS